MNSDLLSPLSLHPHRIRSSGIDKVPTADEWTVVLTSARMVETANATVAMSERMRAVMSAHFNPSDALQFDRFYQYSLP